MLNSKLCSTRFVIYLGVATYKSNQVHITLPLIKGLYSYSQNDVLLQLVFHVYLNVYVIIG